MARIIDGKQLAADIRGEVAASVTALGERGVVPGLAVVLIGDDPASHSYVRMKEQDCEEVGIRSVDLRRDADTTQEELNALIDECNTDPEIHGILVQLPLPSHLDEEAALARISANKDVDGLHPENLGRLVRGIKGPRACTPWGVMQMLKRYDIDPAGKRAVVVGRSSIVGKPMALMLLEAHATVTTCHSRTVDLPAVCREADILVAAIGRPEMLTEEYVKPGAVVIDVGINRTEAGMVGDVDFGRVEPIASWITPVPGGVGPMTRAMLLSNTVDAAALASGITL
ncbi:MAG: bifunctional methylenetetrahydrofolate dehydrogenase/methenyltetrahydrofolate cyclohydrolase FolD [Actinobacteria bacterium HGW-Actinobacteria-10]|jgi:methylenetetrahydrofolate dehydrogenase (NADP+)/methenyltetrahydrofolate cyclohydrolase|nr:MAG: bifunctional methylenetetrahydrofolate dehydrogenase/methenyltetrahydrofolate cyclohydrolase FolD [Actinobacteria bacterium HGW-Actinobacteria-10]